MEHIAPLIQTILWVGLIAGIVFRFNEPLFGLLTALQKRIEAGSTLKAGPFEISDQLRPQDPAEQKEKLEEEVRDLLQSQPGSALAVPPEPKQLAKLQSRYIEAEDLVLRALQAEFGAPINRQVTAGADSGFDGAFVKNGQFHIVEVKYTSQPSYGGARLLGTTERLASIIERYRWKNVRIIVAVVFEGSPDVVPADRLEEVTATKIPVEIRFYSMDELRRTFGMVDNGK